MIFQYAERLSTHVFYVDGESDEIVEMIDWLQQNIDPNCWKTRVSWFNKTMNVYMNRARDAVEFRLRFERLE